MIRRSLVLVALFAVGLVTACGDAVTTSMPTYPMLGVAADGARPSCQTSGQCAVTHVCIAGQCQPCTMTNQCPAGQQCASGACVPAAAATSPAPSVPTSTASTPDGEWIEFGGGVMRGHFDSDTRDDDGACATGCPFSTAVALPCGGTLRHVLCCK